MHAPKRVLCPGIEHLPGRIDGGGYIARIVPLKILTGYL